MPWLLQVEAKMPVINTKEKVRAALKLVTPKGWKWTLSYSGRTMKMTVWSAPFDLLLWNKGETSVNKHCLPEGEPLGLFIKIFDAMDVENFDYSDASTDLFCYGYIPNVDLGSIVKPFRLDEAMFAEQEAGAIERSLLTSPQASEKAKSKRL